MKNSLKMMCRALVVFIFVCFSFLSVTAQNEKIPAVNVHSQNFIRTWLLCGPFPNPYPKDSNDEAMEGYNRDYLQPIGGESGVQPREGLAFTTSDGKEYRWRRYTSPTSRIDFASVYEKSRYMVTYAACQIVSDEDQEILLGLGSDDGMKVWMNGELIWQTPYGRTACPDEDCVTAHVKKGSNLLLIKVDQRGDRWALYARILDREAKQAELWYAKRPRLESEVSDDTLTIILGRKSNYLLVNPPPSYSIKLKNEKDETVVAEMGSLGKVTKLPIGDLPSGLYTISCVVELRYGPLPIPEQVVYLGDKNFHLKTYDRNGSPASLGVQVLDKSLQPIFNALDEIEPGLFGVLRSEQLKFQILIDAPNLGRRWFLADNSGSGYSATAGETLIIDLPMEAAKALWDRTQRVVSNAQDLPDWFRKYLQQRLRETSYKNRQPSPQLAYEIFDKLATFNYRLPSPQGIAIWCAPSIEKVGKKDVLPEYELNAAHVSLARNEYEAVQMILRPQKKLTDLTINVFPGQSESGNIFVKENLDAQLVEYVEIELPSNARAHIMDGEFIQSGPYPPSFGRPGLWPDPLPSIRQPFSAAANENTPLWVTAYAPNDQPPGLYHGQIDIKSKGEIIAEVPLEIEVFDFTLPRETHTETAYGLNINKQYHGPLSEEQEQQVYDLYLQLCASHRISPYAPHRYAGISRTLVGDPPHAKLDFSKFDSVMTRYLDGFKFNTFNLGGLPGQLASHDRYTDEYNRLFKEIYSQVQEHLREKGWLEKAYWYWTDEPQKNRYAEVKKGMELLKWACPDIRRLLTLHVEPAPVAYFYSSVNLWVPVMHWYDYQKAHARQNLGEKVWWYVCTGPKGPYPNNFIDHPAINHRIRYWMMDKFGLDGDLYWRITYWDRQNPWQEAMSINDRQDGIWGNGDGRLLYPPRREKATAPIVEHPVTSIRFECLRDGLEDREYLWLLRNIAESESQYSRQAAELLNRAHNTLVQTMTCYEQSPAMLLAMRYEIAKSISKAHF